MRMSTKGRRLKRKESARKGAETRKKRGVGSSGGLGKSSGGSYPAMTPDKGCRSEKG